jgi:hypothetical protein
VLELTVVLASEPALVVSGEASRCVAQPVVTSNSAAEAANQQFFM